MSNAGIAASQTVCAAAVQQWLDEPTSAVPVDLYTPARARIYATAVSAQELTQRFDVTKDDHGPVYGDLEPCLRYEFRVLTEMCFSGHIDGF